MSLAVLNPLFGPSDDASLALFVVSSAPDFDDLLRKLKSKIANLDLLGTIANDLPIIVEVRELVYRMVQLEAPAAISAFVLDLEILMDQAVSIKNLMKSSINLLEEKYDALSQQWDALSRSEQWLAYYRARIHDQETLIVFDDNIQSWIQRVHYLQFLVETTQKKRAIIDIWDLENLVSLMDAEVNMGIERVAAARSLEKELGDLKAQDLQNDQRLAMCGLVLMA